MFHVVAGWRLVTVETIHGVCGRMLEFWNSPGLRGMAGATALAKKFEMPIFIFMTGETIQDRFLRRQMRIREWRSQQRVRMLDPIGQFPANDLRFTKNISVTPEGAHPDLGERVVIHIRRRPNASPMFEMASATFRDVGMKGRRLTLQE